MKNRWLKKKYVVLAMVAWLILHLGYIIWDGFHDYKGNADVAIILGNTVNADSSLSPWLKGRVDMALKLYQQHRVKKIFASGGKGEFGIKEGDAMKSYLVKRGVDSADIISDNSGQDTFLTANDFIQLNNEMHFKSAIAVTSFYHITRTKYIIRKLGFGNVKGVASEAYFWQDGFGIFREFIAFYKYLLLY